MSDEKPDLGASNPGSELDDEDSFSFGSFEALNYINGYGEARKKPNPTPPAGRRYSQKKKKKPKKKKEEVKHEYVKLHYVEPPEDGIITFKEEDLPSILIGYFDGKSPGKQALDLIRNEWSVVSRFRRYKDWLVFNFESKDDLNRVYCGGPYYACGTPLVLKLPTLLFGYEKPKLTNAEWLA